LLFGFETKTITITNVCATGPGSSTATSGSTCYDRRPARTTWTTRTTTTPCEHAKIVILMRFLRRFRSEFIGNVQKQKFFEFLNFSVKSVWVENPKRVSHGALCRRPVPLALNKVRSYVGNSVVVSRTQFCRHKRTDRHSKRVPDQLRRARECVHVQGSP
jgi:hypothetical protein